MASLDKTLIGKKLKSYTFTVERGKLREFCRAIGETKPVFLDSEAARNAGYEDTPIPPTFQTSFIFWGYPEIWQDMESIGIDTKRLLHMKEAYQYHKAVYPGQNIQVEVTISDVKIGKMNMLTFKSLCTEASSGQKALEGEMTIVIPPEIS